MSLTSHLSELRKKHESLSGQRRDRADRCTGLTVSKRGEGCA
jgi:hypothetical protein